MPPNVFVSSTYVDLKHVREHLSSFIGDMGYTATLFEKGGIGFDWHKPIDESCYEAVNNSDIFVLIIGGRYGSAATDNVKAKAKRYDSITRREYQTARGRNIPIYVFAERQVIAEFKTYKKNVKNSSILYASVDSTLVFELIAEIYVQPSNNFIYQFDTMQEVTTILRSQWAAMLSNYIKDRSRVIKRNTVKINAIKLFYFREKAGLSINDMAQNLGITRRAYSYLESVRNYRKSFDGYHDKYFPDCEFHMLANIEKVLNCPGKLRAGLYDDFLAHYVEFYNDHSGKKGGLSIKSFPFLPFVTRVVVFDFDGTIVQHEDGRTTWEMIWEELGYTINECAENHTRFRSGDITHDEWCKITLGKFQAKKLNQSTLTKMSSRLNVMPGFSEVISELFQRGIKLHIVSGSISLVIKAVLGTDVGKFEAIKANDMIFDAGGNLIDLIGTRYDFQGKADYIKGVVLDRRCSPMDVLFIGNAANDRWAANAGIRTLCVNPTSTDPDDPKHWTSNIRMMENFHEILRFI